MTVQERFTLRNIYLYLVCLITLIIAIFAAVSLVRSTVELVYPDPGLVYVPPVKDGVSSEDLQRQQIYAKDSQRRQAVLGLVGSGATLLITGPLYLYHWRRVQSELPHRPAATATPAEPPTA
jgi:hypothetical protein